MLLFNSLFYYHLITKQAGCEIALSLYGRFTFKWSCFIVQKLSWEQLKTDFNLNN